MKKYNHNNQNNQNNQSNKNNQNITKIDKFLYGGIAGMIAKTTISPLNVIKLRKQTMKHYERPSSIFHYWKGNAINCVRIFPYSGTQFVTFDYIKKKTDSRIAAGLTAGGVATLTTYPLDVMHLRATIGNNLTNSKMYNKLYSGIGISLVSTSLFTGINFALYDKIKSNFGTWSWYSPILYSGISSIISQSLCYPLDTIRRNSQITHNSNLPISTIKYNIHKNKGFYNGMSINMAKVLPTQIIRFTIFENLIRFAKSET